MPYGLTCAPAVFQRLMMKILHGLPTEYVFSYIDDILIVTKTFELHMEVLQMVLDRLRAFNMLLKPSKCHFLGAEMSYLGFIISSRGLFPKPQKLEMVRKWPVLKSRRDISAFLGFTGVSFLHIRRKWSRSKLKSIP